MRAVRSETLAYRAGPITSWAPTASYRVTDRLPDRLFGVTQQPMSQVVTQDLVLQCLDPWGRSLDLPASFGYDPADPWAVWITFRGPTDDVRWFVARELLLRASPTLRVRATSSCGRASATTAARRSPWSCAPPTAGW